jgi:hypothetical protein
VLGIGPFFYFEKAPVQNFRYHDELSDLVASIALANSGPLQIELIQQRNDAPPCTATFWTRPRGSSAHRLLDAGLRRRP